LFVLAISFVSASDTIEDTNLCDICWTPFVKNKKVFQRIKRCPNKCKGQGEIVSASTFQREYGCELTMQFQGTCPNREKDFVADVSKALKTMVPNSNYKCVRADAGIIMKQFKESNTK
jgi:hypothetical protein